MKVNESIICAGFGGQGVMVLGKFLAEAGMKEGLNVTYLPSYGAEVRGGTAHSSVKISSGMVSNPVVTAATAAITMNGPSLQRFEDIVEKGGLIIVNTSMSELGVRRKDVDAVQAPLTDEAIRLGNVKVANMIAAGIYAARKKIFGRDTLVGIIEKMAGKKKELIPINIKAVERGMEIGSKQ